MPKSASQHNQTGRRLAFRCLTLAAWSLLIIWLSLLSAAPAVPGIFGWDKLQHFLAYGLLALLIARVLELLPAGRDGRAWWQAWLAAVLFGLLLECLQWAMHAGRVAEWSDLAADALGALLACVIFRQVRGVDRNRTQPGRKQHG